MLSTIKMGNLLDEGSVWMANKMDVGNIIMTIVNRIIFVVLVYAIVSGNFSSK
jgi:hypothetical protein